MARAYNLAAHRVAVCLPDPTHAPGPDRGEIPQRLSWANGLKRGTINHPICDGARVSGSSRMLRAKTEGAAARERRCA